MNKLLVIITAIVLYACVHKSPTDQKTTTDSLTLISAQLLLQPDNKILLKQRAQLFIEKQYGDSALADLNKIILHDSSDADVYCMLADGFFITGRFNASEHAIARALTIAPEHIGALTRKAEIHFYKQEYDACFNTVKQTLKKDNHNPRLLFIRAMALKETGDTSRAISDLEHVIRQDMNYYNAYYQLGSLYTSLNKFALAEGYFKNASKLQTQNTEPLYALALLYQNNKNTEQALQTYRNILSINKQFKQAFFNMGYIHMIDKQDYQRAIELFDSAAMIDPSYCECYYNKALCYELKGNKSQAVQFYKKAITCRPDYTKAIQALNHLH